jgi:hypothetical protein
MSQTTNQLMEYSVFTWYILEHINYLVLAGLLSYNVPLVFKLKSESGYIVRAGLMSLCSFAIIPIVMFLPPENSIGLKLFAWGVFFIAGIVFASYGARVIQARFALVLSRFTVKSNIRKGAKTDIRYMDKELPAIPNYNPMKYINLKKGVFIGLDEQVKPIYLSNLEDWYKRHFLIVGATRSGKGVAMQALGIQSLMLGETLVFLDPKGDKYLPHIFKQQCDKLEVPYNYIDLTSTTPQINLIADFTSRDLKNCLVESFSQRELGSESDVYRKNEQEFLESFANYICQKNTQNIDGDYHDNNLDENLNANNSIKFIQNSLAELCAEFGIAKYSDKYKSSVSDLNKLCNIESINSANGKSLAELFNGGGCIYIVGDLLDETMKKIQRFIFCRIVQLARNHANYVESLTNKAERDAEEKNVTVFADELVAHISKFVAESYTVSLGWGLKIISAIQDLKLLKGAPADLDPEFLKGAIFGNSQNKLFYRADDIDTADFLSDMTGKIQIEEEQKLVTRNSLNSEKLDRKTRLTQSERNYFDRNMILNLKQFEAIFCASLSYRKTIASLCKTSPITAPDGVNGKQVITVSGNTKQDDGFNNGDDFNNDKDYDMNNNRNTTKNNFAHDDLESIIKALESSDLPEQEKLFIINWHKQQAEHTKVIAEAQQDMSDKPLNNNSSNNHNNTANNGELNNGTQLRKPTNSKPVFTIPSRADTQKTSTSKSDYLF